MMPRYSLKTSTSLLKHFINIYCKQLESTYEAPQLYKCRKSVEIKPVSNWYYYLHQWSGTEKHLKRTVIQFDDTYVFVTTFK